MRSVDIARALEKLGYEVEVQAYDKTTVLVIEKDFRLADIYRVIRGEVYREDGAHIEFKARRTLLDAEDIAHSIHEEITGVETLLKEQKAQRMAEAERTDT